jgi:hypothetical protein
MMLPRGVPTTCSLILAAAAIQQASLPATAHPYIKRWAYKGTIIAIDNRRPERFRLADVRAGDAIHGTLSLDVTTPGTKDNPDSGAEYYEFAPEFALITVAIDVSQTGETLQLLEDVSSSLLLYNDLPDLAGPGTELDLLNFSQDLLTPDGWSGLYAEASFTAGEQFDETKLPLELDVNDWTTVTISVIDSFASSSVAGEIFSLTPIDVPFLAGDFNGDGGVDGRDLGVWQFAYSSLINVNLAADANLDSIVDGADFLVWQRQLGATPPSIWPSTAGGAPEPNALLLASLALTPIMRRRRRTPIQFRVEDEPFGNSA